MWVKVELEQEIDSHLLKILLTKLQQNPQPIMFLFQTKDDPLALYLINNETFKAYSQELISNAINIEMWRWKNLNE